jgi:transposase, IS30 family
MPKTYTHLSPAERDEIAIYSAQGVSLNDIAMQLNRSTSTISRELKRNKSPIYNSYLSHLAQQRASERKSNAHQRQRLKNTSIRFYVVRKLKLGWSPEQIAGRISIDHPKLQISHEAIYQYLYDSNVRQDEDLVPYLARAHKRRQLKGHRHTHKSLHIPHRISINDRPKYILKRKQFGHWETDSVISRQSTAALNVTVERKSRFTKITKMQRKSAHQTRCALTRLLSRLPKHARHTITYDNGSENVDHHHVNDVLGTRSFFCNPFHSWEKGTDENTIGLIRRVFPKKTDFKSVHIDDIKKLQHRLNNRPRKCLSFSTPLEVFRNCCT